MIVKPLASAIGGITLPGCHTDTGFQPPGCLLGKKYSWLYTIQETPGLPHPDTGQINQRSVTGPGAYQCKRANERG